MTPFVQLVAFLVTALVAVVSALYVVLHRNPVVNALGLVVNLASVAILFAQLRAPFLSAVQLILHAGLTMGFFLFVVLLLDLRVEFPTEKGEQFQRGMSLFATVCLLGLLGLTLRRSWDPFAVQLETASAASLAGPGKLVRDHLLSLELGAVLLLVGLVAALVLGRTFFKAEDAA